MLPEPSHIENTVWFSRNNQCLHLMNSEVAWVLVSLGTQAQPQIMLDPDHLSDYLYVFSDYVKSNHIFCKNCHIFNKKGVAFWNNIFGIFW